MGFRRGRVSPGPVHPSSISTLLPPPALSLFASLPSPDQDILAHLVLIASFMPLSQSKWKAASFPSSRAHDSPDRLPSPRPQEACSPHLHLPPQQTAFSFPARSSAYLANIRLEAERTRRRASHPADTHEPTLGCTCFECYSSFWSRWIASPNTRVIDVVLDLFDESEYSSLAEGRQADSQWGKRESKDGKSKGKGKKRMQEKLQPGKKATEPGKRRGKLSWQNKESKTGKGILKAGITEEGQDSTPSYDEKTNSTVGSGKIFGEAAAAQPSFPVNFEDRVRIVENVLNGDSDDAGVDGSSGSRSQSLEEMKPIVERLKGNAVSKRKSRQVTPLDPQHSPAILSEDDVADDDTSTKMIVAKMESYAFSQNFRGRGFLSRVFPDALGGVAERLWDLMSLRKRSETMDLE